MFETLTAYLDAAASPEQKALALDSCQTLLDAGIEHHDYMIEQELAVADDIDSDVIFNVLGNVLMPVFVHTLLQMGVQLDEDAPLAVANDILKGLLLIENHDDPQAITDLCQADESPEVILADLLEMVGSHTSADYLASLQEITPALISRIDELHQVRLTAQSQPLPDMQQLAHARARLSVLVSTLRDHEKAWSEALLEAGLRLGTNLDDLLNVHSALVERAWEKGIADAAVVCALLGAASSASGETLTSQLEAYAQSLTENLEQSIAFRAHLTRLLRPVLSTGV